LLNIKLNKYTKKVFKISAENGDIQKIN
jgi:hypothetical protein